MKKLLIKISILILLCLTFNMAGCASVSLTSSATETKLNYKRLGMMKLDGFELTKDASGITSVRFNKSEGAAGDLAEAILNLTNKIP